jgi:tetratricopeptide (TPR) repeat protein
MRAGIARALIVLALTSIAVSLTLDGCMSKAKRHLYAAEDLFEKQDLKGARSELEAAIQEDPNLLDAHKSLAHIDERLGDEEAAAREYDAASRLDPADSKLLAKARYYRLLKQMEDSIDEATGDIKAGKFDEGLTMLKDAIHQSVQSRSKVLRDKALEGLIKAAPMIAEQGDGLVAQKKYDDAVKTYDSAIRAYMLIAEANGKTQLDPAADKVLHSANQAAKDLGAPDRTFKLLNDVLTLDPDNKPANLELAQVYLSRQPPDYDTAADLMERGGAPDAEVKKLRAKARHR